MFFFKKKIKEEEEEPVKQVKRKKKKEEPQKPWGRLERIIVLIFLLGIPIISIIFFVQSKNFGKDLPKSITPKIITNVIPSRPKDIEELRQSLEVELQNSKSSYGIWVESLDGSYNLGINETDKFEGASLFKVPLMIAYFKEVDKGTINPNTNYSIKHSDQAAGAGALSNLPPGTVVTYRDIVEAMGKNSDNTAFQIMINILGTSKEEKVIKDLGMENTDFKQSLTTAYDIGRMFYNLFNTDIISNNSKNELLDSLKDTSFENLIAAGIPDEIEVAHKYASVNNTINDAGIVYSNKPFVLVILGKMQDMKEAEKEFLSIANIVYNWAK